MDDDRDGPGGPRAESDRLRADWESATPTGPAGRQDDSPVGVATKWWRWYAPAGRWMPSEPPPPAADPAYWFVSDSPPAFRGPRPVEADEGVDGPGPQPTPPTSLSSSAGQDA